MNRAPFTFLLIALTFASWSGAQEAVQSEGITPAPTQAIATTMENSATVAPEEATLVSKDNATKLANTDISCDDATKLAPMETSGYPSCPVAFIQASWCSGCWSAYQQCNQNGQHPDCYACTETCLARLGCWIP